VTPPSSPNERFNQVESTLEQLSNSFRHLLTAQVLMNDRLERAESAIQKVAEQSVKLTETMQALAEQQKQTETKLDTLTDIVRKWYERPGNGAASH
jgi:methyl-accepting chemotaxis protein